MQVTNWHVVKGAQDLQVSLQSDKQYGAKVGWVLLALLCHVRDAWPLRAPALQVVGYDEDRDVAVLQVLGPTPDRRVRTNPRHPASQLLRQHASPPSWLVMGSRRAPTHSRRS